MKTVYLFKLFIVSILLLGVSVNALSQTSTFNYTGSVQTWMVPAGVTSLFIDAQGAKAGVTPTGQLRPVQTMGAMEDVCSVL